MKKHLLLLWAGFFMLASCEDKVQTQTSELEVDSPTITASLEEETYTVTIRSNTEWTAAVGDGADWCTLVNPAGDGDGTFSVNVAANELTAVRTATITVTTDDTAVKKEITVNQAGIEPLLTVEPETIPAIADAGTYTVAVSSNTEWTATVSDGAEWCTLTTPSGDGDGMFGVNVVANDTTIPRTTKITVTTETLTKEVAVNQDGKAEPVLSLSADIEAAYGEGTYTIEVTSNVAWTAAVSADDEWCVLDVYSGQGNGTINVTVDANMTVDARDAVIMVSIESKSEEVALEQAGITTPADAMTNGIWVVSGADGMQIWSDAINLPVCNKADFVADKTPGVASVADCRNNPNAEYGYLYTMKYIVDNAEAICPEGWRVPGPADFSILDKNLGGTGNTNGTQTADGVARYGGPEWGGTLGGYAMKVYSDINVNPAAGKEGHYRGLPAEGGVEMSLKFTTTGVAMDELGFNTPYGMQVRCIKE